LGVYRRCLNALNQDFKVRTLDAQEIKSIVEKATKEAAEKQFSGKDADKERRRWIDARVNELRRSRLANHFSDPRAAAKEGDRKTGRMLFQAIRPVFERIPQKNFIFQD